MADNKTIKIGCLTPSCVIIFLVFFLAKIYNKIDWDWIWVLSPLWIPAVLVIVLCIIIILLKIWSEL